MNRIIMTILLLLVFVANGFAQTIEEPKAKRIPKYILRNQMYEMQRAYPFEQIPENADANAWKELDKMLYNMRGKNSLVQAQQNKWRSVGPFNVGGRVKSIVVHPTNPDIVYIGAASGGVWKTTNAGAEWIPLMDDKNRITMGSLAMDMKNPDVLYAATGEAVGGASYAGSGVYKTTDGGASWFLIGLTGVEKFSKIYIHPSNSNLVVAAGVGRQAGVYVSEDAGKNWERKYAEGSVTDLSLNPMNENNFLIGVNGIGVLSSTNKGNSWQTKNNGDFQFNSFGRISVQMANSVPSTWYALFDMSIAGASGNTSEGRIYKTTNSGDSWFLVMNGGAEFFNGQGFYDNYIQIHPSDPNQCLVGGIDTWRTSDGVAFANQTKAYTSGYAHPDQHCAAYAPSNHNIVYLGNDGGMYRSTNAGVNWTSINNGLAITQFYDIGLDPTKENVNYGGTQDNGTVGSHTGVQNWSSILGGDGFDVIVNPNDPNKIICESQYGNVALYDVVKGFPVNFSSGLPSGTQDNALFHSPLAQDVNDPTTIYHGRKAIYFNQGSKWDPITPTISNFFSSVAGFNGDNDVYIYGGTNAGELYQVYGGDLDVRTVHGNGIPNRFITHIEIAKYDAKVVYVTVSGYGTPHVFKTTNAGDNWFSISDNLPNVPVSDLKINPKNPNNLFIATDIGVFTTFDDGKNWLPLGHGLPRSPVSSLEFLDNPSISENIILRAGTYGRSVWEIDLTNEAITSPEITIPIGGEQWVKRTNQRIAWSGFTNPVKLEYSYDDGKTWEFIAQDVVGNNFLWYINKSETFLAKIRISSQTNIEEVVVSKSFTINNINRGTVLQEYTTPLTPYGLASDGKGYLWATDFYRNKLSKLDEKTYQIVSEFTLKGDSLYTDLTIDKASGTFYLHRLYASGSSGFGGLIEVYNSSGVFQRQFVSPAKNYPIALEYVDGKLIAGDRDDKQELFIMNPVTGVMETKVPNACQDDLGPRGLCYDGVNYLYQNCTNFPGSTSLVGAAALKIEKANMSVTVEKIALESLDGIINARGIEYDPSDKNLWISDFGGNIYKIAGFETVSSVENSITENESIETGLYPNPMQTFANVTFKSKKDARLQIEIFDFNGKNIGTLFDYFVVGGQPQVLQITNDNLSSGTYSVVFTLDGKVVSSEKLVVVK